MILSDNGIRILQKEHNIITPYNEEQLQSSSYDLTFNLDGGVYGNVPVLRVDDGIVVKPNQLTLISTNEKVFIPTGYVGEVNGKSSLGRIGLFVHITAGYIDTGFKGNITLELYNVNKAPIVIYDGCSVAQLVIHTATVPCEKPYDNHYQCQEGVKESIFEECFVDGMYHIH